MALQAQFGAALWSITAPVLVRLANPPTAEDAAVLDRMTSTTIEIYDGRSHYMHLVDPDRFAERVRTWITALQ